MVWMKPYILPLCGLWKISLLWKFVKCTEFFWRFNSFVIYKLFSLGFLMMHTFCWQRFVLNWSNCSRQTNKQARVWPKCEKLPKTFDWVRYYWTNWISATKVDFTKGLFNYNGINFGFFSYPPSPHVINCNHLEGDIPQTWKTVNSFEDPPS